MTSATVDDLRRADRVLLYGVTGAGKSTAAVRLGDLLSLPVHLVDEEVGWLPGWKERAPSEQRELAAALVRDERWVLDSAYSQWADLVLPRVQVVVALDYPGWLSFLRLLRRTGGRWWSQEEICNGNTERAADILSSRSILRWHVRSYRRKSDRMRAWECEPGGIPVLRVTHPRQLDAVLQALAL